MGLGQRALLYTFAALVVSCLLIKSAQAAPDRLDDTVRDAVPDSPGAWAFSLGGEWLDLDGALVNQSTTHNYFKIRYQFDPKVAASIGYQRHNLAAAEGLLSPLFNQQDNASVWNFDLAMNLQNTPAVRPEPGSNQAFTPGSAFTIGVAGNLYETSAGAVSDSTTVLKAYLLYSADLSEEMRAHTFFSSGRMSGGGRSGSVNSLGAGLDYELIGGENPLTLMANGVLDIYNFRDPTFNTSRVSRFDLGLRYRMARGFYGTAGWMTVNDSENDASGSGLFAGLNYVFEPEECIVCDPALEKPADKPADKPAAPQANAQDGSQLRASAPMMESDKPALQYPATDTAGLRGTEALIAANSGSDRSTPGERAQPPLPLFGSKDTAPDSGSGERTTAAASSKPAAAASTSSPEEKYEHLLIPGRNAPLERLSPETVERVKAAREGVVADYAPTQQSPVAGDADNGSGKSDTLTEEQESTVSPSLPVEQASAKQVIDEVAEPAAEAKAEAADTLLADQLPSKDQSGSDQTDSAEASQSNKYTRASRFDFPDTEAMASVTNPDQTNGKQTSSSNGSGQATLLALDTPRPTGLDSRPGEPSAKPDDTFKGDAQPAIDKATPEPATDDPYSSEVVLIPLASSEPSKMQPWEGASPASSGDNAIGPASNPTLPQELSSEPQDRPKHVRPGEVMQRAPVSDSAKQGLKLLMSFMLPARTEEPQIGDQPAEESLEPDWKSAEPVLELLTPEPAGAGQS